MAEEYTKLLSWTPRTTVGPVNCLLFIQDATLLVSGGKTNQFPPFLDRSSSLHDIGDDQVVRLWDVQAGKCLQELVDPQWGQITALSWLPEQTDKAPVLFIGTGRGVVSAYPFSAVRSQVIIVLAV